MRWYTSEEMNTPILPQLLSIHVCWILSGQVCQVALVVWKTTCMHTVENNVVEIWRICLWALLMNVLWAISCTSVWACKATSSVLFELAKMLSFATSQSCWCVHWEHICKISWCCAIVITDACLVWGLQSSTGWYTARDCNLLHKGSRDLDSNLLLAEVA